MRAAIVRSFEQAPQFDAIELPAGEGVVVDVLAAALSPRARSGAAGAHYASSSELPLVPGIDGVGRLPNGRRVYFVGANDRFGTMAEQALANSRLAVELPESVSSALIAAGMLPAISSWVALTKRAPIQPGQSVLVLGATGTSGLLAVQIAKLLGAGSVIAVGRNAKSLERAKLLGADQVIGLDEGEAIARAASEVDIVVDYLWGNVTSQLMPALLKQRKAESRALRWILIGSMAGDEIALSSVLLRKRNLQILGSGQGATTAREMFSIAPDIVAAFAAGTLAVDVLEVPLADVAAYWAPRPERVVFIP
jgi:NADPH:quinone reductase-like Zn-dependent oxidoreductase